MAPEDNPNLEDDSGDIGGAIPAPSAPPAPMLTQLSPGLYRDPAAVRLDAGSVFAPGAGPGSSGDGGIAGMATNANNNHLTLEQAAEVERRFSKEQRTIRRRRGLILALAIHATAALLINGIVWASWAPFRQRQHQEAEANSWPPLFTPPPPPPGVPGWVPPAGVPLAPPGFFPQPDEEHEREKKAWPWPSWVTLGTGTLLLFHAINTLPLSLAGRSRCPHWNYWIVANLAGVIGVQWAVYVVSGGAAHHDMPWPLFFTAVAAATACVTSSVACVNPCSRRSSEVGQ